MFRCRWQAVRRSPSRDRLVSREVRPGCPTTRSSSRQPRARDGSPARVEALEVTPKAITVPDTKAGEIDHLWPETLPGGRVVLFTVLSAGGVSECSDRRHSICRPAPRKSLLRGGTHAMYLRDGPPALFARRIACGSCRSTRTGSKFAAIPCPCPTDDGQQHRRGERVDLATTALSRTCRAAGMRRGGAVARMGGPHRHEERIDAPARAVCRPSRVAGRRPAS